MQVQFTRQQVQRLKQLAGERGCSAAEVVRQSVEEVLADVDQPTRVQRRARARAAAGRFRSGMGDLAGEHDRHLAEVLGR